MTQTPPAAIESLKSLAAYLASAVSSDLEKVRAIYKWITKNITYRIEQNYQGRLVFPAGTEATLGAEFGYVTGCAALAGRLCDLMEIEHKQITGFCKVAGYNPVKALTAELCPNHAWNVVKLNGAWKFMDCTWGAGHVSDNKEFVKQETDFYFLPDPDVFIEDHFPYVNSNMEESMSWQLLPSPIDLATFHQRVRRQESCFECDVELESHKNALLEIDTEVTIKFKGYGDPLTNFSASFVNPETQVKLENGSYTATVLDLRKNEATVTARPPASGSFWELRIYGTTDGTLISRGLVSYQVLAKRRINLKKFPNFGAFYGLQRDPEACGFTKKFCNRPGFWLKPDGGEMQLKFETHAPVNASVSLRFAEDEETSEKPEWCKFCLLEQQEQELTVSLRLHRMGFYRLTLFCANKEDSQAERIPALANYLIDCSRPLPAPRPFPDIANCWKHRVDWRLSPDGFIDVLDETTLKFKGLGLPLTKFRAVFVNPSTGEKINSGKYTATVLNHNTNEATVTARPPTSGISWTLQVFGTTEMPSMTLDLLASYDLVSSRNARLDPFPDFEGFYGFIRNPERCGFSNDFRRRQALSVRASTGEIQLKLPAQQPVRASALLQYAEDDEPQKHFVLLEMHEQNLKVSVRMHRRGFHRLVLFCKDVGSDSDTIAEFANFLIECSSPMQHRRPFPEVLPRSLTERVVLESPRDGELTAKSDVKFRLGSPSLKAVMVECQGQSVHRRSDSGFDFTVRTGPSGSELKVFGARDEHAASFFGLIIFHVI